MDVKFLSESPDDSNARATDLGIILEIKGKILAAANGDAEDDTRKVAQWSLVLLSQAMHTELNIRRTNGEKN